MLSSGTFKLRFVSINGFSHLMNLNIRFLTMEAPMDTTQLRWVAKMTSLTSLSMSSVTADHLSELHECLPCLVQVTILKLSSSPLPFDKINVFELETGIVLDH